MENKLTDNDIIKALECCEFEGNCTDCPKFTRQGCMGVMDEVLDLINRQKAEIERLEHQLETLCLTLKLAKSEAIKEFTTEFEKRCIAGGIYPAFVKRQLQNVKKEMVGE